MAGQWKREEKLQGIFFVLTVHSRKNKDKYQNVPLMLTLI